MKLPVPYGRVISMASGTKTTKASGCLKFRFRSKRDRILLIEFPWFYVHNKQRPGSFESGLLLRILFPSPGNTAGAIIGKVKFQELLGTVLNAGITVWNTL